MTKITHEEQKGVPLLYVRVYRAFRVALILSPGSLTICEGISPLRARSRAWTAFPYYM